MNVKRLESEMKKLKDLLSNCCRVSSGVKILETPNLKCLANESKLGQTHIVSIWQHSLKDRQQIFLEN